MHDLSPELAVALLSVLPLVALVAEPRGADAEGDETADLVLARERAYLAELARGNPDPFLALVAPDVSYFEPDLDARIDDRASLARLFEPFRGQALVRRFDLERPRVQRYGDAAIVTFRWAGEEVVDGKVRPSPWNAVEVWQLRGGDGHIVSSHWSFNRPGGQPAAPQMAAAAGRPLEGVAVAVVAAERACLDRWKRGDPGGFIDAAAPDITYFDPTLEHRVDGREEFTRVMEAIRGKVVFDRYELLNPRVQLVGELAVLTFNYRSWTVLPDGGSRSSFWNSTEAWRQGDEGWQLVHSHWSRTRAVR